MASAEQSRRGAATLMGLAAALWMSPALAFGVEAPTPSTSPLGNGFGLSIPGADALPATSATDAEPPVIHRDLSTLPPAVAAMREKIIAAARTGDYDEMRKVVGLSDPPPVLSPDSRIDPVEAMRTGSGDPEGFEVLAILLDVLDAGWIVKDEGTPQARYVWPYFADYPLEAVTPSQMVEIYRVLTAGDFEQMRADGSYEFYRVEIAGDGRWLLFMSGE